MIRISVDKIVIVNGYVCMWIYFLVKEGKIC